MEYTVSAVMEKEFVIDMGVAEKYLTLYIGEPSVGTWKEIIYKKFEKAELAIGTAKAKEAIRKDIAFAIMLPSVDRTKVTNPPENLFRSGYAYEQYNERDWVALLAETIDRDKEIEGWRNQCLSLGVVSPLEYSPVTREAFNRLFGKAQDSGVVNNANKSDMVRRFQNLVYAYGGNVICYLFMKEEFKINKKVLNWRSNYFFERLIFDVYTFDQVFKIKKQELAKTNPKLVRSLRK